MPIEIVNSFDGLFIGTVMDINTTTREVAVYLPKLMPAIPINGEDVTFKTNLGNSSVNIAHSSRISTTTKFWVNAEDSDEPMPNINSKVEVYFLESNPRFGFWRKFKPDSKSYSVIDSEKYKKIAKLNINNVSLDISEDDEIIINLGDNYTCTKTVDGKKTIINIIKKELPEETDEKLDLINEIRKKLTVPIPEGAVFNIVKNGSGEIIDVLINIKSSEVDKFLLMLEDFSIIIEKSNIDISIKKLLLMFLNTEEEKLDTRLKKYNELNFKIYSKSSSSFLYDSKEFIYTKLVIN